jgi:hypothetical protein
MKTKFIRFHVFLLFFIDLPGLKGAVCAIQNLYSPVPYLQPPRGIASKVKFWVKLVVTHWGIQDLAADEGG